MLARAEYVAVCVCARVCGRASDSVMIWHGRAANLLQENCNPRMLAPAQLVGCVHGPTQQPTGGERAMKLMTAASYLLAGPKCAAND